MSFIQTRTQEKVSVLKTAEGAMMTAPAIFFSLFAGAYSDRRGRRLLLALPFLGNILSYLAMAANLHWWEELPAEYLLISGQSADREEIYWRIICRRGWTQWRLRVFQYRSLLLHSRYLQQSHQNIQDVNTQRHLQPRLRYWDPDQLSNQ